MKKKRLPHIRLKRRFMFLSASLIVLLIVAYFIKIPKVEDAPKDTFTRSFLDNSYTYKEKEFTLKLSNSDNKVSSEVSSNGSKVTASLSGFRPEVVTNDNLFKNADPKSVLYSLDGGKAYLQYQILRNKAGDGLKENIILKDKTSPRTFTFALNLQNISSYKKVGGNWEFYDLAKKKVFEIPQGIMQDSKKVPSDKVSIEVKKDNDKTVLTVKPDNEWLDDPSRVYPVYVDPTVSVVITGGITDTDAQFGGLQRKVTETGTSTVAPSNTITYVQSKSARVTSTTTIPITFNSTPATGNLIVVSLSSYVGGGSPTHTVADNKGNTYYKIDEVIPAAQTKISLWYAKNVTSSTTFTVTGTATSGDITMAIHEYSGADLYNPLVTSDTNTGSGTSVSAGPITSTYDGQLFFGTATHAGASMTSAAGAGWDLRQEQENVASGMPIITEDKGSGISLSAGSQTATFTIGSSASWGAIMASFTPPTTPTFTSSAWYSVYSDSTDVFYAKSTDPKGNGWGSGVDLDPGDANNVNPTLWKDDSVIYTAWVDTNTDTVEVQSIDANNSDALGTKCTSSSPGALADTYTVSLVHSGGLLYLALGDTSTGSIAKVYKLVFSGCTFTDITTNSGLAGSITGGSKPVLDANGAVITLVYKSSSTNTSYNSYNGTSWEGWDASTGVYTSKIINISPQESNGWGVFFNPVGTVMYTLGSGGATTVDMYTLSTPWDISTASYASISFLPSQPIANPAAVFFFKPDGTSMYLGGYTDNNTVYQYSLSTPWDITTATYTSKSFSFTPQQPFVGSVSFKPDGTSLYAAGNGANSIYQYSLTIPWDISTAVYASKSLSVAPQDTFLQAAFFDPDGRSLYASGRTNDAIFQYTLSTPWDLSTATYASKSFSVGTDPRGTYFKYDGTAAYIMLGSSIRQYSLTGSGLLLDTANSLVNYSMVSDGDSEFLLGVKSTTDTVMYKFDLETYLWTSRTAPWTGVTNASNVSLTYDSTGAGVLYGFVLKDASEQAYYKSYYTGKDTWSTETSLGFTPGDLSQFSSARDKSSTDLIGGVVRQGSNLEFAQFDPANLTNQEVMISKIGSPTASFTDVQLIDSTSGGDIGEDNAVAIGTDTFPVMAYHVDTGPTFDLLVAKCSDISCINSPTITTVDSVANVSGVGIAIGADNLPIISYIDNQAVVKVLHCGNAACSSGNTTSTVETVANLVSTSDITIASDGFATIVYSTNTAIRAAHCSNTVCSSSSASSVNTGSFNDGVSITMGADNLPFIAHIDGASDLIGIHCGNSACSSGNSTNTVSAGSYGGTSDVVVNTDGFPIISMLTFGNEIVVADCGNAACSSGNTVTVVTAVTTAGDSVAIGVGGDGLPIVVSGANNPTLNMGVATVHCTSTTCSSSDPIVQVYEGVSSEEVGLAIGTDGFAFMTFSTYNPQYFYSAHCGTYTCTYSEGATGPTWVQSSPKGVGCVATTSQTSFSTLPTAGNTIMVPVHGWSSGGGLDFTVGSVTDNQGNTYTRAVQSALINGARTAVFYAYNIGAPTGTFTITVTTVLSCNVVGAAEFSGMPITDPIDVSTSGTGTSATPNSGTTATTTQASEVAIAAVVSLQGSVSAITNTAGFTDVYEETDGASLQAGEGNYKILSAFGTQASSWTLAAGSNQWSASIATFKGAASPDATLFSRLVSIDDQKLGTFSDTGTDTTLFGRLGSNTDFLSCTATECSNVTLFGLTRNNGVPKGKRFFSIFGGDGSVPFQASNSNLEPGFYQFAPGTVTGTISPNASGISPGNAGLFLFYAGNLAVNGSIDVSGFGNNGGNGGNGGNGVSNAGGPGEGGSGGGNGGVTSANAGANGTDGTGHTARGEGGAGGTAVDLNSGAGAGGGGGGGGSGGGTGSGFGGGGGGGGASQTAGANGGNGGANGAGTAANAVTQNNNRSAVNILSAKTITSNVFKSFGAGGGGGAGAGGAGSASTGSGGGGGGGGGAGGGILYIEANAVVVNNGGSIFSRGQNGGDGGNGGSATGAGTLFVGGNKGSGGFGATAPTAGGVGGNGALSGQHGGGGAPGGGGGGGVIYIRTHSFTNNGTVSVSGGASGANGVRGGTTGFNGGSGSTGANGFLFVEIVP